MEKIAHYDDNGDVTFYDPGLNYPGGIPKPNIEITDDEWQLHVSGAVVWRVDPKTKALYEYTRPAPSLEAMKKNAAMQAKQNAAGVRVKIKGHVSMERVLGWFLKAQFACVWAAHELAPSPITKPLAAAAAAGFSIETDLTGEDPKALRDRSIAKAGAFFHALQLVEGMERLAENEIEAAATPEALDATITKLRAMEAEALTKLAALTEGNDNA